VATVGGTDGRGAPHGAGSVRWRAWGCGQPPSRGLLSPPEKGLERRIGVPP
jgi:hypothetical protein